MSQKNSELSQKLSWKRAFHLLKCVALRKFRIKYHEKLNMYEQVITNKQEKIAVQKTTMEKIVYAQKFKPETRWIPKVETDSLDQLAKTVISGIVEEIRSRSSSSAEKTLSASPPTTPDIERMKTVTTPTKEEKQISKYQKPLVNIDKLKLNKIDIKPVMPTRPYLVREKKIDGSGRKKHKNNSQTKNVKDNESNKKSDKKEKEKKNSIYPVVNPLRGHRPSLEPITETKHDLTELERIPVRSQSINIPFQYFQKSDLDLKLDLNLETPNEYLETNNFMEGINSFEKVESETSSETDELDNEQTVNQMNEHKFDQILDNNSLTNFDQMNQTLTAPKSDKKEDDVLVEERKKTDSDLADQKKPSFPKSDKKEDDVLVEERKKTDSDLADQKKPSFPKSDKKDDASDNVENKKPPMLFRSLSDLRKSFEKLDNQTNSPSRIDDDLRPQTVLKKSSHDLIDENEDFSLNKLSSENSSKKSFSDLDKENLPSQKN